MSFVLGPDGGGWGGGGAEMMTAISYRLPGRRSFGVGPTDEKLHVLDGTSLVTGGAMVGSQRAVTSLDQSRCPLSR